MSRFLSSLFALTLLIGLLDSHPISVFLISLLLAFGGIHLCRNTEATGHVLAYKLLSIVSVVYILLAFLISFVYREKQEIFIDCYSYIENLNLTQFDIDVNDFLIAGLVRLEDLNVLHEIGYRLFIIISNNYLDGASIFTLTYIHTIFGIFSSILVYRLMLIFFNPHSSYKYTLTFALLSPFLVYSTVILRDIIIAFLYLLVFDIVLREFKISRIVPILLIIILVTGCRLYSGLFLITFLLYYIYKGISHTKYANILIVVGAIVLFGIVSQYVLGSDIMNQSKEEIEGYVEYDADRSTGFSAKLAGLPTGAKELALSIYSQVHPFPFYDLMKLAYNVPTFILAIVKSISVLWWYFIFYGLCYALIIKNKLRAYNILDYMIFVIIAIYIVLNSTQIDVRRIMTVYPLIYLYYIRSFDTFGSNIERKQCNSLLAGLYFSLLLVYIIFIQR